MREDTDLDVCSDQEIDEVITGGIHLDSALEGTHSFLNLGVCNVLKSLLLNYPVMLNVFKWLLQLQKCVYFTSTMFCLSI